MRRASVVLDPLVKIQGAGKGKMGSVQKAIDLLNTVAVIRDGSDHRLDSALDILREHLEEDKRFTDKFLRCRKERLKLKKRLRQFRGDIADKF